jgi:hypothetical protein
MHGTLGNASRPPVATSPRPSKHHFGSDEFVWDGLTLRLGRGRVLATVEPDSKYPGMWRVRYGGQLSDMANLSRAKDAAVSIALSQLNTAREAA